MRPVENGVRDLKIVKGLVNWLTGGLSARVDYIERDVETLEAKTTRLSNEQDGMGRVLQAQHRQLENHERRLTGQAEQMIALRKMHGQLANRLGEPFPGKMCDSCGAPMLFDRVAEKNSYSLFCSERCGEFYMLPEANLLESFRATD